MSSTINSVTILCWNAPTKADRCAHAIAAHLGAEPGLIVLNTRSLTVGARLRDAVPESSCLIASADALAEFAESNQTGVSLLREVSDCAKNIFVYGFSPDERHRAVLRDLSSGSLTGVSRPVETGAKFRFVEGHREWCGPFSGLSVGSADPEIEKCFQISNESACNAVVIRLGDQPFFVRTEHAGSHLFLVACDQLADLDESVQHRQNLFFWFSRLVPLMMFLRGALGKQVWHSDRSHACFIIDDPLLKRHYGFLDYQQLMSSMERKQFTVCIAFIPWNYRRSDGAIARHFSSSLLGLHLCVHGCDHTRAEFASTDFESLAAKAQLALQRMQEHAQRSGVPFDDVMVFPQGLFSAEALCALKASGYLAAVNTDSVPTSSPVALKLSDLLEVAVTRFAGVPLFGRHYPRDVAEFALDIFLGKPVLAVEHHSYFRDGYEPLENFVAQLNHMDDCLEWRSLGEICSQACLTRTTAEGEIQVRFYTDRFSLTNAGSAPQKYVLFPRQWADEDMPRITCDGHELECEKAQGQVRITLVLNSGQSAQIAIHPANTFTSVAPWRGTALHNFGVSVRRFLCELRDNRVDTSRTLSLILSGVRSVRRKDPVQSQGSTNGGTRIATIACERQGCNQVDDLPVAQVRQERANSANRNA